MRRLRGRHYAANIQIHSRKDLTVKNNRISSILRTRLLARGALTIFFVCVAMWGLSGPQLSPETSAQMQPPQSKSETRSTARLVSDAKRAGSDFQTVEPFQAQTRSIAADAVRRRAVKAGSVLQLRRDALPNLVRRNTHSLTLRLPSFGTAPIELELVQVNLFAPGFNVVTSDSNGRPVAYEHGVHYWGVIKGVEGSLAAISIFKDEVIGFYSSPKDGNFVLGKLAGNNPGGDHILDAEKDGSGWSPVAGGMPDSG